MRVCVCGLCVMLMCAGVFGGSQCGISLVYTHTRQKCTSVQSRPREHRDLLVVFFCVFLFIYVWGGARPSERFVASNAVFA